MGRGLLVELRWFLLLLCAAVIVGYAVNGSAAGAVILYLLGYIALTFYRLQQLEDWVVSARRAGLPGHNFYGVWGEIAEDVKLLSKRYQKDKLRLQAVVSRVQEMTSALPDSVILIDNRANIDWWNRAAQHLLGFHDIDRGHKLTNIIRNPRFVRYFESGNYSEPLQLNSMRQDGQYLEFQVHTFGQGERLLVVRDISRMRRLEQMRKDFVANVSHELRTPLTVVLGYLETLGDSPDLSPTMSRALAQMHDQGKRMTSLINDLITLSKLETEEASQSRERIDLDALIETIISDAKALSGEAGHQFSYTGKRGVQLLGSERELRSAISNLCFNAVKYSPAGAAINVDVSTDSGGCAIAVHDDGIGIDPRHIPRLTERFYRVDNGRATTTGGTGLGLAIVKHVLLRHQSELRIDSRPGKGSTFTCRLPAARVIGH